MAVDSATVLIVLPPSETKQPSGNGPPLRLDELSFPELTDPRDALLDDLVALSADPVSAGRKLFTPPTRLAEVARNTRLRSASTMPAVECYTGVLYDALDVRGMTAVQRSRADARLVITSAVFGMVRATDLIPAYRCSNCARLPHVGTPERYWRAFLPSVVAPLIRPRGSQGEFVVDLRSGAYTSFVALPGALTARVVTVAADGTRKVVSHFSKQHKGFLARALVTSRAEIRDRAGVLRVARTAGLRIEPLGPAAVQLIV